MIGHVGATPYDLRFSLFGIPVRVHPVFWLTSAILASSFGRNDPRMIVVGVLCIFVAILVHEMGHAVVTRMFGWYPQIVLEFLGGYATTGRHSTWKNIAVTAAGPAAGFTLFGLLFFGGRAFANAEWMQNDLVQGALNISLFITLVWNLFNLVPVLPLDGGQICRELLCWITPRSGVRASLIVGIAASGAITMIAARQASIHGHFFFLDPVFVAIFMGLLCFQNIQAYRSLGGGYYR